MCMVLLSIPVRLRDRALVSEVWSSCVFASVLLVFRGFRALLVRSSVCASCVIVCTLLLLLPVPAIR